MDHIVTIPTHLVHPIIKNPIKPNTSQTILHIRSQTVRTPLNTRILFDTALTGWQVGTQFRSIVVL